MNVNKFCFRLTCTCFQVNDCSSCEYVSESMNKMVLDSSRTRGHTVPNTDLTVSTTYDISDYVNQVFQDGALHIRYAATPDQKIKLYVPYFVDRLKGEFSRETVLSAFLHFVP